MVTTMTTNATTDKMTWCCGYQVKESTLQFVYDTYVRAWLKDRHDSYAYTMRCVRRSFPTMDVKIRMALVKYVSNQYPEIPKRKDK